MVFSSSVFLFLFLPAVLLIYFVLPRNIQNLFLLLASLLFYAWGEGLFVAIMFASIVFNYLGGLVIARYRRETIGKIALLLAVIANLALLGSFKYANFLVDNLNFLIDAMGFTPVNLDPVHLPIGISFFTFQAMSYVIDVYRGEAEVQRNPINSALYIALFPQLIAGPIVRYHHIAKQLVSRRVSLDGFTSGVTLFIFGLGKKMLIANPMGEVADQIFAIPAEHLTFGLTWLGLACYTLQIYFDFSGYSDMAIGLGRMFGFRFLINFNYPYIARSIQEFWRRWHISLSRWFRDYLYIPLGGNRCAPSRVYANLLIVFFLVGLWHGASWNFVLWGMVHGGFLILERSGFGAILARGWAVVRHLYVLLVVMLAWVLFRADTLDYAWAFIQGLFGAASGAGTVFHVGLYWNRETAIIFAVGVIAATPVLPWLKRRWFLAPPPQLGRALLQSPVLNTVFSVIVISLLLLIVLGAGMHLAAGTHNPFIYFRF
jgi:alginate O-acetyltransferase complex protein AlgI